MAFEVGSVVSGKVTGITNFGAFIELSDGKTGLCHISEIANDYVKDVKDHLKIDQEVKVKILGIDDKGKMNLSIKKSVQVEKKEFSKNTNSKNRSFKREDKSSSSNYSFKESKKPSFEDLLSSFIKDSDDKQRSLKKNSRSTRRGNGFNGKR